MPRRWFGLLIALSAVMVGTAFSSSPRPASVANPPPGPDRFTVTTVDYTAFTWWVASWSKNQVVCSVVADHEGAPTPEEIYRDCGNKVYQKWVSQPPCNQHIAPDCIGYYVFLVDQQAARKEIPMELPAATAWLTMVDCEPVESVSTTVCEGLPSLVVYGQEPLPDQTITRVEGTLAGKPFACDGSQCVVPLEATDPAGAEMSFWAYSSYGDSSIEYTALVRAEQSDAGDPDQLYWYIDVISSQWQGQPPPTCSETWESFPPVGGTPPWLSTPVHHTDLASDIPYTYLAANLIIQGAVDARACPDGGLLPGGGVNACGLEAARPAVNTWQDQFDGLILDASQQTGVPAHLLKNLFARESQFWPGVLRTLGDLGLGQLTENGADTTLIWNPSFFAQFCPLVLSGEACGKGYLHLKPYEQLLLRQALVSSVNATCANCPLGLDLGEANFSVTVFAHTMVANCEQAGRVVRNITGDTPGHVASYEDLWKFTLVNYNAGPGCLGDALEGADLKGLDLTWDNVSPFLPGSCTGAIDYVNDIAQ